MPQGSRQNQPRLLGWKCNPHTWGFHHSFHWNGPMWTWAFWTSSCCNSASEGATGTELVGLSDGVGRWLLAARRLWAEWQPCTGHQGEILIVTDTERVIKSVWKVSQKTEKLKRECSSFLVGTDLSPSLLTLHSLQILTGFSCFKMVTLI